MTAIACSTWARTFPRTSRWLLVACRRSNPGAQYHWDGWFGRRVIVANDATVKRAVHGHLMTVVSTRAQEVALQNMLLCIYSSRLGGVPALPQDEVSRPRAFAIFTTRRR